MLHRGLVFAIAGMMVGSGAAFGFTIDGSLLDDWDVSVADNNASTFDFVGAANLLGTHVEDQNDSAGNGGYLGPNYGGQNYDAEMMAVALQGDQLLIAIVTGQRPDNGFKKFGPGDIRIETSAGTYAVEVGGGRGGATGSAIAEGAPGATYTLNGNGYTTGYAADPGHPAGTIWAAPGWLNDPINPKEPTQIKPGTGTYVGTADYAYTLNDDPTNQHAVIELAIQLAPFAGQTLESVHWRPGCGNDELDVNAGSVFIPEPSAVLMLLGGSMALIAARRQRR